MLPDKLIVLGESSPLSTGRGLIELISSPGSHDELCFPIPDSYMSK